MRTSLSGSRVSIAMECGWAFHKDSEYATRPSGEAAAEGTLVHERLAGDPKPIAPELALAAHHGEAWLGGRTVIARERTYAFRPSDRTVRVVGDHLNREYEKHGVDLENEIPITVDLVGRTSSGEYFVLDWKTGRQEFVEPAQSNIQIGLGAYCVAFEFQARKVYGTLLFLSITGVEEDTAVFGGISYMKLLGDVETAWMNTKRKREPRAGDHCRYCPALGGCPVTKSEFIEVLNIPANDIRQRISWTTEFVDAENDRQLAIHIPAMEKALDAVKEALKKRGPIDLGNGKTWKPVLVRQQRVDMQKVSELIGARIAECQKTVEFEQWRQVKS